MELCADVVVVFADLTVGWVHFGFCSSVKRLHLYRTDNTHLVPSCWSGP